MAMSEYSLSDIATASRENGFGGDTTWCMIILFAMIFGWGGNGFGFGNRGPQVSQLLKQACATP